MTHIAAVMTYYRSRVYTEPEVDGVNYFDEIFTEEFMSKIIISTSPANGLPPLDARASARKAVTNFSAHDIWNHGLNY